MAHRFPYCNDGGFGSVGMALALLVSASLLLGATQVYRIKSAAADVQNVADLCALAAEKQVASFYVVAQVCDSAVLSMSLCGNTVLGLGMVAACVPPAQSVSAQLLRAGRSILEARSRFARNAKDSLEKLQSLLPIFAALDAEALARSNNSRHSSNYHAIAMLVPLEGTGLASTEVLAEDDLLDSVGETHEQVSEAAAQADEAAREANEHKMRAFMADCGASPGYCMHERASWLAGMAAGDNPIYASVDAWSFAVALRRAQAYYPRRLLQEAPAGDSLEEHAKSAIRREFYSFAVEELSRAYVHESENSFDAYFPLLPRNTEQMRATSLYTSAAYPVSLDDEGVCTMHAWEGCPKLQEEGIAFFGSVKQMEEESMRECPSCRFRASSIGKVAAASTSIDNGFEHHYLVVAQEAALYSKARRELEQHAQKAKGPLSRFFDHMRAAMEEALECRIKVHPPGEVGAVVFVVDASGVPVSDIVPNALVGLDASLGTRFAISAASLANDDSDEAANVVSLLFDGIAARFSLAAVPGFAFDIWSHLLVGYAQGQRSLVEGVEEALDSLPLLGASGLGAWAAGHLESMIEELGLAPADLSVCKPVLVNSFHVASGDDNSFCKGLLGAKELAANAYGPLASGPVSALVGVAGGRLRQQYAEWDSSFVIARIELLGPEGPSIPLELALPPAAKEAGLHFIDASLDALLGLSGSHVELRRWE